MSIENDKTIEVYKDKASTYLKTTIEHDNLDIEKAKRKKENLENFIKTSFSSFEKNSKVLEIGAGDGENSKYIKSLGYNITASDVADDFLKEIKSKDLNTIRFNILKDKLDEKYKAILAWRVFVHFTEEDLKISLENAYKLLEENGIFIFNVMNRETRNVDEEWVDFPNEYHMGAERFYKYFRQENVERIINDTGYKIEHFHKEGGDNKNKWLVYVIKKEFGEKETKSSDPFYSESSQKAIKESIKQLEEGKVVTKTMEELDKMSNN